MARAVDDRWRLSQILARQAAGAYIAGDLLGMRAACEEGRDLADTIGDRFHSRMCRFYLGIAQMVRGDLAGATTQFGEMAAEAEAAHDEMSRVMSLGGQSLALAYRGEAVAARAAGEAALEGGAELGGRFAVIGHVALPSLVLATYRPEYEGALTRVHGAHMSAVKVSGSLSGAGRSSSADQLSSTATCSTV
jgi:hypothetical protein